MISEGLFKVEVTKERNCKVILTRPSLDHEKAAKYELIVQLKTLPGVLSKKNSVAKVDKRELLKFSLSVVQMS